MEPLSIVLLHHIHQVNSCLLAFFSQLDISFPFLLHSHVWCAVGHKSDLMLQILVIINMLLSLLYLVIPSFIVEDSAEALSIGINTKYKFFALVCCCCCCIQVYNFCFY